MFEIKQFVGDSEYKTNTSRCESCANKARDVGGLAVVTVERNSFIGASGYNHPRVRLDPWKLCQTCLRDLRDIINTSIDKED